MRLKELAEQLALSRIEGNDQVEIGGIEMDSRKVKPGDLFICITGLSSDGHDYARQALERGAAALVVERDVEVEIPKLFVKDTRFAMSVLSCHFFDYPSHKMKLIGVTGTNGKTTTTYLLDKIFSDAGQTTGLMGTIQTKIGGETIEATRTTQESVDLQRNLARMAEVGTDACFIEVSSHALVLGRVKGARFRTAIFTNLTQDHLDYHQTMERYKEAKGLFFSRLDNGYAQTPDSRQFAILNADDPASADYAQLTAAQVITYGVEQPSDFRASNVSVTSKGTSFTLTSPDGQIDFSLQLFGKFNVYNSLGAIAAAWVEGIPLEAIKRSLEEVSGVDGRMETVNAGQEFSVIVDYAHSPDGLENVLTAVSEVANGNIITVFGCGGDRDRTKRPIMGEIAARLSDYIYVTSDNPRSEEPEAILLEIEQGIKQAGLPGDRYELVADRREAIEKAIERASSKDVVLIAGKGHEPGQTIKGVTHEFDDRIVAKEALRRLAK